MWRSASEAGLKPYWRRGSSGDFFIFFFLLFFGILSFF